MLTLVAFLGVLAVLIIAHELGHFITAKASGVKVEEFGLGFPPRLLSVRRGETLYSLNAIPLGGFVKMAGEEDPKLPRSLASKNIGTRLLVLSAGSLMNLMLPILLFSVAFMVPQDFVNEPVAIEQVAPNSPAANAGIAPGDIILEVNGNTVYNSASLHRYIQLSLGKKTSLLIRHPDSTETEVEVVPRWKPPPLQGAIGIKIDAQFAQANRTITRQSYPFWRAIPMGARECVETFILFKNGILGLLIGAVPFQVTGPVGIAQMTGEVAKAGVSPLLEFAAFLSINLGIINIFPLPALDGGRIAFVLLELVRRGKRISARTEGLIHTIGFILLMTAMLAVTYQDIVRIVSGEGLIP